MALIGKKKEFTRLTVNVESLDADISSVISMKYRAFTK